MSPDTLARPEAHPGPTGGPTRCDGSAGGTGRRGGEDGEGPRPPPGPGSLWSRFVDAVCRLWLRILRAWARLLARPGFRRASSAFPLTRPYVRHRSRQVFRLATGFVASQAMAAVLRLGLLERLLEAPRDADQLARELDLPPRSTRRLLQACETLGLVRRVGRFFVPGPLGAPLVDNPEVRTMLAHSDLLYRDLSDPVELMRDPSGSRLSRFWPYARGKDPDPETAAAYSRLMVASQQLVADEVLAAVDLSSHRRLLDVAGGEGAFLARVGRNVPGLELGLFELPAVAERARRRFRETDLEDRVTVHGGDFFDDRLPSGADVVTLSRVLLDHDDPDVRRILSAVHEALAPGGTLVVAEPLAGRDGAGAAVEAYFSLYFLAMGSGRPRTRRELAAMLAAAGFHRIRFPRPRIPVQTGIVTARRRGLPGRSVNDT